MYNGYITNKFYFFIMRIIDFDDNELETILSSLDDYLDYHDEETPKDELIGGISVLDRVTSIREKIESVY